MVGAGWVNAVLVGDHLPELEIVGRLYGLTTFRMFTDM